MSLSLRCIASCASNRQKLKLVSPIQQEIRGNMWQLCAWPARCSSWGLNCQSNHFSVLTSHGVMHQQQEHTDGLMDITSYIYIYITHISSNILFCIWHHLTTWCGSTVSIAIASQNKSKQLRSLQAAQHMWAKETKAKNLHKLKPN